MMNTYQLISRWSVFVLFSCVALFTLSGCPETFKVYSKPTPHFPETWSKRIERYQQEKKRSRITQPPNTVQQSLSNSPKMTPQQTESPLNILPPKFEGETERLAVLELANRAPQLVSKDEVAYLTNELRTVASYLPSPKFLVLTQESLEALIDPSTSLEECIGSCAVETGRLIGARWILTGQVVRFGSSLRVSLKLHDTKNGQFLKGASIKGKSVEELEESLHTQALTLTKEVAPQWGAWLDQKIPKNLKGQLKYLREHTQ